MPLHPRLVFLQLRRARWRLVALASAGAASAIGCGAARAPDPAPAPSASAVAGEPRATLAVSLSEVRFEGDAEPIFKVRDSRGGADAALKLNGADDFFIKPLGEALTRRRAKADLGGALRVAVAPEVSSRLVFEILFTANQVHVTSFVLDEPGSEPRSVRVTQPVDVPVAPSPMGGRLDVALLFSADGVGLTVGGRNVQPGCDHHPISFGPHLTFLRVGAEIDVTALRACAENAKKTIPDAAAADTVTLVASAKDPPTFDQLAEVAATVESESLFPKVRLAMVP